MTAAWLLELAACPLAAGPFPPEARRCDWCGTGLEGRRRRWCSDVCSDAYSRNHAWTSARAAAIRRDRVCVRCGSDGRAPSESWAVVLEVLCPRRPRPRFLDWCRAHDWFPDHVEARDAFRADLARLDRPWEEALRLLARDRARHGLVVNHRVPCLGAHSESSCAHHLDGEVARDLRVAVEVRGGAPEVVRVVAEESKTAVAPVAQESAHQAGRVVVVYVRDDLVEAAFADGTRVPLTIEEFPEVVDGEAVQPPEVSRAPRASERAVERVGPPAERDSAEQAGPGGVGAAASVTVGAPRGAEPALAADELRAALDALGLGWRAVRGARPTEAVVVPFAQLTLPPGRGVRALVDGAGHPPILAVVGVPAPAMPRRRGGLEVLCHPCHVAETARQRRAGLLRAS